MERALLVNPDSASPWSPFYNIQAKGNILQFVCLNKLSLICMLDDTGTITIASARSGAPYLTLDLPSYLDDTADFDAEDWSIEATEKSALLAWSRNLDDPLLSFDPGIGILNWASITKVLIRWPLRKTEQPARRRGSKKGLSAASKLISITERHCAPSEKISQRPAQLRNGFLPACLRTTLIYTSD